MNKVLAAALALSFAAACTPSAPNAVTPSSPAPAASSAPTSGQAGSSLVGLKKISYDLTTETMGVSMTGRITTEFVKVTADEVTVKTTTTFAGQTNEVTTTSKLHDGAYVPSSGSAGEPSNMTKVGTESVTVKAGTFNADKYTFSDSGVNATYWISDGLVIKSVTTASQQGVTSKTTMELVERQ